MQEILAQVFSYVWGVWRHRWLAMVIAWAIAIAGWIWVWQLPESYVAKARIYVDTNSVLKPLLAGLAIQPNVENRISLLSRTLLSRPNLEKLMRMTDLDLQVTTARERDALLNKLSKSIGLSASRQDKSLYSIWVRDPDRDTAKRVAQALITVFIESSLTGKQEDTSGAHEFLENQIQEYEERLIASERRTAEFQQKHRNVLGGRGGYYKNLNSAKSRLRTAQLQLKEEQNRMVSLQRQLEGEDPLYLPNPTLQSRVPLVAAAPGEKKVESSVVRLTPVDTQIQTVQAQLSVLTIKYTERHPEVRKLLALLDDLMAEKAAEEAARLALYEAKVKKMKADKARKAKRAQKDKENGAADEDAVPETQDPGFSGLVDSPVFLDMRKMLAQTKAKVAGLTVRVKEYQERIRELEAQVSTIPQIEGQLKQLDRDYRIIKGQHSGLLRKRELARLGKDVDQKASNVTFRVIDPAYVPLKPSEPNKMLLNGMVMVAGLAAGIGVALLVSLLFPVVFDARTLMVTTGLPVLGTVSISMRSEEKRKERMGVMIFASLGAVLLLTFLGVTLGQGMLWS